MKRNIENKITSEVFAKIVELEKERNQEKQKVIAKEIINALDIEDFTPYMAYDNEGDIFIALNYDYSSNEINNSLITQEHDIYITSDGVYINDELDLKQLKEEYNETIKEQYNESLEEAKNICKEQKEFDDINEKLEFFNNQLMNLVNFQRPKYVGDYEKIIKIDEEIGKVEEIIKIYENKLKIKNKEKI